MDVRASESPIKEVNQFGDSSLEQATEESIEDVDGFIRGIESDEGDV